VGATCVRARAASRRHHGHCATRGRRRLQSETGQVARDCTRCHHAVDQIVVTGVVSIPQTSGIVLKVCFSQRLSASPTATNLQEAGRVTFTGVTPSGRIRTG
jgi:hypothetical protein